MIGVKRRGLIVTRTGGMKNELKGSATQSLQFAKRHLGSSVPRHFAGLTMGLSHFTFQVEAENEILGGNFFYTHNLFQFVGLLVGVDT